MPWRICCLYWRASLLTKPGHAFVHSYHPLGQIGAEQLSGEGSGAVRTYSLFRREARRLVEEERSAAGGEGTECKAVKSPELFRKRIVTSQGISCHSGTLQKEL